MFKHHFFVNLTLLVLVHGQNTDPEMATADVPTILSKHGYASEVHHVTTSDGYILILDRILSKKQTDATKVLFLNHGFISDSTVWILRGPDIALGYLASDEGHDVWMINNRGNGVSNATTTPISYDKFWNINLDDTGKNDTAAAIDYILEQTNKTDLAFIGHSAGCTLYFILCAERPEYEDKINLYIGLSPLLSMRYTAPSYQLGKVISTYSKREAEAYDIGKEFHSAARVFCQLGWKMCKNAYLFLNGWSPNEISVNFLKDLLQIYPTSSSSRNFYQIAQWIGLHEISKYNYGLDNYKYYGRSQPPFYNLSLPTKTPKYFMYGSTDGMIVPQAVEFGLAKVKNIKQAIKIKNYSHSDLVFGETVKEKVNVPILTILAGNLV